MKDMILFPEDIDCLNGILLPLTQKANLLLAVLINKDGRLLTHQGMLDTVDIISLAALVAGNSASTLAIAHLVGETEFCAMYHQGKDKHIYIANVDEETFLALIFDDRTNIDRVKVFARQFERDMKAALVQVYSKSEDQVDLDMDLGSVLFGNVASAMQQTAAAPQYAPSPAMPPQAVPQQAIPSQAVPPQTQAAHPYPQQPPQADAAYMDANSAQHLQQPPQQYR